MSRLAPALVTAPVAKNDRWILKALIYISLACILGPLLVWAGIWLFTPSSTSSQSASAGRATSSATAPTAAEMETAHCFLGTTKTYPLGREPVLVNKRGFCSTAVHLPDEGCVYMRAARSKKAEGPFGQCRDSKGLRGVKDAEYMWSAETYSLTVDVTLGPPDYRS